MFPECLALDCACEEGEGHDEQLAGKLEVVLLLVVAADCSN